jgi:Pyruvate/2-oxoacid:ferredoxin oxidoreductase gamma subunit
MAVTLLAMAFFAEGREVQSFATYGGARRGTPVSAFIRIDERFSSTRACSKRGCSPPPGRAR